MCHLRELYAPIIEKVAVGVEVVRLAQFVIDEANDHIEVLFALVGAVGYRTFVAWYFAGRGRFRAGRRTPWSCRL